MDYLNDFFQNSYKNKPVDELIIEATILYEDRNYEKAIGLYSYIINLFPNYALTYYLRANALEDIKKYEDAISDYRKYIELGEIVYNGHFKLGFCLQTIGKYYDALNEYDLAIEKYQDFDFNANSIFSRLNPLKNYIVIKKERILNNRATAKLFSKDNSLLNSATDDINEAINLNPDYSYPYYTSGLICLKIYELTQDKGYLEVAFDNFKTAAHLGHKAALEMLQRFSK